MAPPLLLTGHDASLPVALACRLEQQRASESEHEQEHEWCTRTGELDDADDVLTTQRGSRAFEEPTRTRRRAAPRNDAGREGDAAHWGVPDGAVRPRGADPGAARGAARARHRPRLGARHHGAQGARGRREDGKRHPALPRHGDTTRHSRHLSQRGAERRGLAGVHAFSDGHRAGGNLGSPGDPADGGPAAPAIAGRRAHPSALAGDGRRARRALGARPRNLRRRSVSRHGDERRVHTRHAGGRPAPRSARDGEALPGLRGDRRRAEHGGDGGHAARASRCVRATVRSGDSPRGARLGDGLVLRVGRRADSRLARDPDATLARNSRVLGHGGVRLRGRELGGDAAARRGERRTGRRARAPSRHGRRAPDRLRLRRDAGEGGRERDRADGALGRVGAARAARQDGARALRRSLRLGGGPPSSAPSRATESLSLGGSRRSRSPC